MTNVRLGKLVKPLPFQGRDCEFEPRTEYKYAMVCKLAKQQDFHSCTHFTTSFSSLTFIQKWFNINPALQFDIFFIVGSGL